MDKAQLAGELTPDLALVDPSSYITLLLDRLKQTSLGGRAWERCVAAGTINPGALTLVTSRWPNRLLDAGVIEIGTAAMPEASSRQLFFGTEISSYGDQAAYRLVHELAHCLLDTMKADPVVRALRNVAMLVRVGSGGTLGLTALGSRFELRNADPQEDDFNRSDEDLTELVAMYLWDPNYLSAYGDFLASPECEQERLRMGVEAFAAGPQLTHRVGMLVSNVLGLERAQPPGLQQL